MCPLGIGGRRFAGQVDEICLLNTMLIKVDGSKMLFPNIMMASQGIINIARSGLHGEFFPVSLRCPLPPSVRAHQNLHPELRACNLLHAAPHVTVVLGSFCCK